MSEDNQFINLVWGQRLRLEPFLNGVRLAAYHLQLAKWHYISACREEHIV